jgi:ATPase subunit of ABC transporter with duplicated ATPase domains
MAQYVYTMNRVGKVVPPKRKILEDISLSFFPGAKIGVLGLNGSGKSSLLRIMAGVDREYEGEARPQPGIHVGYLSQEPALDPDKDVRGNVEEGLGESKALLDRFNEISARFAEPMSDDEMTALLEEQGKLQDAIEAAGGWELDRKLGTSRPITWMRRVSAGWNASWSSIPAPWSLSPMTATSSTMPPAGSWNSIAGAGYPGRATIPPGWSRRSSASRPRKSRPPPARGP